jgi:dinuclear metal center YbgI/SA1388 family protein
MRREDLTRYLAEYLDTDGFVDYCPNGLQVEGRAEVERLAMGVTASVATIRGAIERGADALVVHHGIIWKGVNPTYTGGYRERVRLLLEADLNLYGFHLPLDAHPEVGNSVRLAATLDLTDCEPFGEYEGRTVGTIAQAGGIGLEELVSRVRERLGREPIAVDGGPKEIHRVGIITGGAQSEFRQAITHGLDAYITGEASERNFHEAKEEGVHFISAGHHATETWGVRALGEHLSQRFGLEATFVDVPNPV